MNLDLDFRGLTIWLSGALSGAVVPCGSEQLTPGPFARVAEGPEENNSVTRWGH